LLRAMIAVLALVAFTMGSAEAQSYPTKPVRIIVGFAAGGIVDEVARYLADFITRETGQQAIVENAPGAAGTIALATVARSEPDGYTIGVGISGNLVISAFVQKNVPVDVLKDLTPIAALAEAPIFVAVGPNVPAATAQEFLALARSRPGGMTYGSAGVGSLPHLSAALFAHMAGLKMVHVPYRGATPAIVDLMGGRIDMISSSIGDLQNGIQAGKLKVLLAAAKQRLPYLPDVPTSAEVGLPDYVVTTWLGLVTPNGVPKAIQDRLHELATRMIEDPATQRRLAARNIDPLKMTQAQFAEFIRAEYARWGRQARDVGVEPQ
jgi:tripartite-type tricarboxylate transporter receptor subunit TctC